MRGFVFAALYFLVGLGIVAGSGERIEKDQIATAIAIWPAAVSAAVWKTYVVRRDCNV